jgi:uncharacterized protein YjiS (DUF1127 family)
MGRRRTRPAPKKEQTMSTFTLTSQTYRRQAEASLPIAMTQVLALAGSWYQRARQRRQLAELSDRQLADIGINRAEACAEAGKPFWQE